jgi:acyl-CoA oxidase
MCDLYALSIIDKDIGSFRDVIKKNKASGIRALVVKLCAQLRTHALSLVNAFQIPEYLLDSPIGRKDGDYEKHILDFAMDYTKQASSVLQQTNDEEEENTVIEVK